MKETVREMKEKLIQLLKENDIDGALRLLSEDEGVDEASEENTEKIKTDFLSRMSHDLRTPLNVIIGLTALTLDGAKDPVLVYDNMTKLRAASDYMLSLINDILDMSKLDQGKMNIKSEPYMYSEFVLLMQTMYAAQCKEKGVELIFHMPVRNPVVMTDKRRLNQLAFHILSNALKYTPAGGKIEFSVHNLDIREKKLTCDFVIEDTGIGMTEEFQKHLFEPFVKENSNVTSELQGSGLGLTLAKEMIGLLGGDISIKSTKNQGTTVTLHMEFELVAEQVEKPKQELAIKEISYRKLPGKKVLLVEDHPMNAMIAKKLLEKQQMQVVHVENGRKAVDLFSTSPEYLFDAILMDIRMPEMSGIEATRTIRTLQRQDAKQIPIIAMSANSYEEDIHKSIAAGMNDHLAKPIDPTLVYETLEKYIE